MNKEEKIKFANKYFLDKENKNSNHIYKESYFSKLFPEIYLDIISFGCPKEFKFGQKLWHYIYEDHDFNKVCKCSLHGKLKFLDFRRGYRNFCKVHCDEYNKNCIKKSKETRIKNCGSIEESYKLGKIKQIKTCLDRYGVVNGGGIKESLEKIRETKLKKYGSFENLSKINKEKSDLTKIRIYGSVGESYRISVEKRKKTLLSKPDYYDEITRKAKQTKLKKYGSETYNNYEQAKQTCLIKYGVDNIFKSKEFIERNIKLTHEKTLSKYNEILYLNDGIYHCRCVDSNCDLCENKEFDIDIHTFFNRKFYNIDLCTNRTPISDYRGTSDLEKSLLNFIKSIYSGEIIENDRKILSGKELDIYLPELKIAFEFNGLYWHNEFNKDKNYHQQKSLNCIEKNIQLIHIWEDDWNFRNDIIKDYIKSKLSLSDIKIGARKCVVKEVNNKDANSFLNLYHIQGGIKTGKNLGLYYKGELVEILTFGQLRKNMGSVPKNGYYEIYRVCSKSGYNIQGGFSKLLKYFEYKYNPICVITYGNLDYTIGNVYKRCGFITETISKPTYTWVVDGVRRHRSNFMKSKLDECKENPELTETEVMYKRGCYRCWDSGKIKFIKVYKES